MTKRVHETMKYIVLGLISLFFVLCAGMVKYVVEVDLPSDGSVRVANLSTDIFADYQPLHACSSDEDGDSLEDLDDVIINIENMGFFLWSGVAQRGPGVCPPIVWRPLPKIPIA